MEAVLQPQTYTQLNGNSITTSNIYSISEGNWIYEFQILAFVYLYLIE